MGPADLSKLVESLAGGSARSERILVGPETADDAGVFDLDGTGLAATTDLITPVCDDPYRYGRVAAANAMSDVFAMGGEVLFALNICCFPEGKAPVEAFGAILRGGLDALAEAGGVLLGGHSVRDEELKYGLAVVGRVDPDRILTNAGAVPGQRVILTKALGSGAIVNGFRAGNLDEAALEPALASMERLNLAASRRALAHGATACTDVSGFGIVGHALEVARASRVGIELAFARLPVYDRFHEMATAGICTKGTRLNRDAGTPDLDDRIGLEDPQLDLLFDPQTSGGLLIFVPAGRAEALVAELRAGGDAAAVDVGEVVAGAPRITVA